MRLKPDLEADLQRRVAGRLAHAGCRPGDGLVVAVSGGMDSCVLLDVLMHLPEQRTLHVAHLDHQLRSAALEDATVVRQMARLHRLPCTIGQMDVGARAAAGDESIEMAARACRREFLQATADRTGHRWIVLAHHEDDQIETILLRLLRGTSSTGLAGMRGRRDDWLRPLLGTNRAELRQYARDRGLQWREDESNYDIRVPRNRVRHQLLPHLRARHNPQVGQAISRAAGLLADEDDFLQQETLAAYEAAVCDGDNTKVCLEYDLISSYHIAIQRRILRMVLQGLASSQAAHSQSIHRLLSILHDGPGAMQSLSGDLRVQVAAGQLILRRSPSEPVVVPLVCPGRTQIPGRTTSVEARWSTPAEYRRLRPELDLDQAVLDAGPDLGPLVLRQPQRGDRLKPLGMGGRAKKLSDCFIDVGWPRILREDAIVLSRVADDEILWVAGLARSERHRVDAASQRLLYLRTIEQTMEPRADET